MPHITLPVATPWFEVVRVDDATTRLTEPHLHPLLRANVWHVRGRDRDLVIDTGLGVADLRPALPGGVQRDVLAVATHAHTDHVGGLHEFDDRAIHRDEAHVIAEIDGVLDLDTSTTDETTFRQLAGWGYDIRDGLLTAIPRAGFPLVGHPRVPTTATRVLDEGEVIDLGDRTYEVLHLPGHSPGSIGLWEASTGTLFSGDTVYDGPLLDEIGTAEPDRYVRTMERLLALPVDVVHAGHEASMGRTRFRDVIRTWLATV